MTPLRCHHGFLAGFCRCPTCGHFEGDVDMRSRLPHACQGCGARTTRRTLCRGCTCLGVSEQRRAGRRKAVSCDA